MKPAAFERRPHPHCQRGLTWLYKTPTPLPAERLSDLLQDACGEHLVMGAERWAGRAVRRFILQFQFEVRWLEGSTELHLLNRVSANAEVRRRNQAIVEDLLTDCVRRRH